MESEDFVRINQNLDEGKTCCLCIGLEQGYNIIGALSLIGTIYSIMIFFVLLSIGQPLLILIFGCLCVWEILNGVVWL